MFTTALTVAHSGHRKPWVMAGHVGGCRHTLSRMGAALPSAW